MISFGVAFPRLRLASDEQRAAWGAAPRDVQERTVPAFDEDAFTLAVAAAKRALPPGPVARPARIVVGSRDLGADPQGLAVALGFDGVTATCVQGDPLPVARELPGPVLVVAADVPRAPPGTAEEAREGAGAVAFWLAGGSLPAAKGPAPWLARTGDLGAAQPMMDVLAAMADKEAAAAVDAALAGGVRVPYARALQERGVLAAVDPLPDVPMGAYVPEGTYQASLPARWRLEGALCRACDRAFLPAPPRCLSCGGGVVAHRFPPRGRVFAATVIGRGGAPSEFAEQQRQTGEYGVAIVDLEKGARTVAQVADAEARPLAVGAAVEPVLRRLYRQNGVWRYGLKWRPT